MPRLESETKQQLQSLGRVATIGIEMAVSIAVGFFGGRWLDAQLGTEPWFKWVGFAAGLFAGFRSLFRLARKMRKELDDSSGDGPGRDGPDQSSTDSNSSRSHGRTDR
jgi:F0F1-type ATP synthase assembly protein I